METLDIEKSRLDGNTAGFGCVDCPILKVCGGWTRIGGGWSCSAACAECEPETCDKVCIRGPSFAIDWREVNGFGFSDIRTFQQNGLDHELPRYIPLVYNGSNRMKTLRAPWVAVPLDALMRKPNGTPIVAFQDALSLLKELRLHEGTRLLLSGIRKDPHIEEYWKWRKVSAMVDAIARLHFRCAVTPNYSLSLAHPRPQHLFNRKRVLICGDEWSRSGIAAIPSLQAVAEADYQYWFDFLSEHTEVSVVCQEFQTGLKKPERAALAIKKYALIQDALRRPLHFVAFGGFQFRSLLRQYFTNWTIVDSTPFIKAHKRRKLHWTEFGFRDVYAKNASVADLLEHNIRCRMEILIEAKVDHARSENRPQRPADIDHRQMSLA